MKSIKILISICALALSAQAADIVIIANNSVADSEVSSGDLKVIFLGSKTSLGSSRVEPVLEAGGAAHEEFLKEYVGKSDAALKNYYKSLVFSGKGSMPRTVASDSEMVAYVAKTKGAIGYVSAATEVSGVKKLPVK